jgi:Serine dehydrogenase proteinase
VLVPHHAFSAATLTALGADDVVMHPLGCLGPTDPTVANQFNPQNPQNPKQLLGISVEDVSSYIDLVQNDVGIHHEEELVQAFAILARKVHPLALGNVKRATSQSRMMGEKLLRLRNDESMDAHDVTELIENLTSQLYFHGHPINRNEARDDLRLGFVQDAPPDVEAVMTALYEAYAADMRLDEPFQPLQEAYAANPVAAPNPPSMVMTQQGPQHLLSAPATATVTLDPVKAVMVESNDRTDAHEVEFEVTLRREWTGELAANFFARSARWVADSTPVPETTPVPEEPDQQQA